MFGGENEFLRKQEFVFIICLNQIFLDTTQFRGHKNTLGGMPSPVATGLDA